VSEWLADKAVRELFCPPEMLMTGVLRTLDAICGFGAFIAALCCALLAIMLIVEVITTSFFAYSQPWAVEYSGYLLAAILFAGSGWTLGQGAHIRVALFMEFLGARAYRFVDLAISLFALGIAVYVSFAVAENAARSLELGSVSYYPSATPVWIPQAVLAFGWIVLCLGLIARIIRLISGRTPERPARDGVR
jgi:TRAP-type mannitol/chloroaromatic compound transport system permease small subunit